MKRVQGFTLVELLVAVAILGTVIFYMTGIFTVNQKAYVVIDQVTETQQNMRAIGDLIERDLRHAGFMVPIGGAICGVDNLNTPDILYVTDALPLDPAGFLDPSMGAAFPGGNVTAGTQTLNLNAGTITLDGVPFYDTNADGVLDSDFQLNGGVIITDLNDAARGSACGTITSVNAGAETLIVFIESGPLGPAVDPVQLLALPAHEYRVNGNNQLVRDGMVLTQGVEDLQFSVFIDANDNNVVDVNEFRGDGVSPDYVANANDHSDAREVRVSLVLRTRSQDREFTDGQFQRTENRTAVAGNDGFRRRVHTSRVLLRNLVSRSS